MLSTTTQSDKSLQTDVSTMDQLTAELGWVTHRHQTQRLKAFDLTVPQFMTMRALAQTGETCTMSELAEMALQVSATLTGIINRLEERGLVERLLNPADRRSFRVSLTAAGEALLDKIAQQKRSHLQAYLSHLPTEKRQELLSLLQDYLQAMTAELS
jgi:DNA-binding MarR family transcriptional regulator